MNAEAAPVLHQVGNVAVRAGVSRVDGKELQLTSFEANLLTALIARPDQVVTTDALLAAHYGSADKAPDSGSLYVVMGRLRRKLRDAGAQVRIDTARARGFRLVDLTKEAA